MIQKIFIKDFKCHEDWNSFTFPGLSIISGTNNSGKSSLLQSVYILTQHKNVDVPMISLNEQLKLGSFSDILNKQKSNEESIEFAIEFSESTISEDNIDRLRVTFIYKNPAMMEKIKYKEGNPILDGIEVEYKTKDSDIKKMEISIVDSEGTVYYKILGDIENGYCKINGLTPEPIIYDFINNTKKICSDEFEVIRKYISFINKNKFCYLKAYRVDEYRDSNGLAIQNIGIEGEYTGEIICRRWHSNVDYKKEDGSAYKFSQIFDFWIKKILGEEYSIISKMVDKNKYKVLVSDNLNEGQSLNQVGFGISQLLPILTLILTSNEGDVILIENPEIHLHPKLQADIADFFIFAMESGRKIILETHSEHIINRVRLRIKEKNNLQQKINIYFFEKEQGVVRYQEIEIDRFGKIRYWPKNFFDQGYEDMLGLIRE